MPNPEKVILKIISVTGHCAAGHREDQEFDLSQDFVMGVSRNEQTICPHAFYVIYPQWLVLRTGGEFHWEKDKEKATIACPDPFNPVVMELRRVRE